MITRRGLLGAGAGGLLLSGCDRPSVRSLLESAAGLHEDSQRLIAGKQALAREFPESAMSPQFRVNGIVAPITAIPFEKEPSPGSAKV